MNGFESVERVPKRVVSAAVRFGGETFPGANHPEAFGEMKLTFPLWEREEKIPQDGFVTSAGRFVDRKEAWHIALAAGQLDHLTPKEKELALGSLASEHLVDSSMVEESPPLKRVA